MPDTFDIDAMDWSDVLEAPLAGRGFDRKDLDRPCDRLPADAEADVTEKVWGLSRQPVGLSVRFATDSTELCARWTPLWEPWVAEAETQLRMVGLDLYGQDTDGKWYHTGWGLPWQDPPYETKLNKCTLDPGRRVYQLYLPHSIPLTSLSLGVLPGSKLELLQPEPRRPIVAYGTSICHGSAVSRPGMAHLSILSRKLDWPVVNLGFSGNGRMDLPVVDRIARINAAVYVVDCLPNMSPDQVTERVEPLIERLRADRPDTPILFVGTRMFGDARFAQARRDDFNVLNGALNDAFDKACQAGWENIHLLKGANFYGDDFEGSVDASHPSDLGAMRMAEALLPEVKTLLTA